MYTRELLFAAGLLLLLLLGRREHLTFTDTVKDIRNTVDQAEQDRIFAMAPASLQQKATALNAAIPAGADRSKSFVAAIVRDFQTEVYVPATAPITETVVDNYITQSRRKWQELATAYANHPENGPGFSFYLETYSNGDAKRLLMTYLNLAPARAPLPLSTVPTSSSNVSIPRLLEQMRDNLLEYKMTGQSEYKSVYEGTKSWLDTYIADLNTQLTKDADAITSDVATYRSANTEMTQTQADFQRVKTEGPQLDDAYRTIKTQMDQNPVADTTGLYVKGGIAAALALGAIVLALA